MAMAKTYFGESRCNERALAWFNGNTLTHVVGLCVMPLSLYSPLFMKDRVRCMCVT